VAWHSITRLVLEFLEKNIRGRERVLDYGRGSGILAIAATEDGWALLEGRRRERRPGDRRHQ